MAMTIAQKIVAAHAGVKKVESDDIVTVGIDLILGNDASAPIAIKKLEELGMPVLKAADKLVLVADHFTPTINSIQAGKIKSMMEFGHRVGAGHLFPASEIGVEHALLPEVGLVKPGDLIIGGDSHTCTYGALGAFSFGVGSTDLAAAMVLGETWLKVPPTIKIDYEGQIGPWIGGKDLILYTIGKLGTDGGLGKTVEFAGSALSHLCIEERLTIANMAVEMGAVNGIMTPDQLTKEWLKERNKTNGIFLESDPGAVYEDELRIDVTSIGCQVAKPFSPGNVIPVEEIGDVELDQVFIGSCTNGRLGDLRQAAAILKGRKVAPGVRLYVSPATRLIFQQALNEGLIDTFQAAGASILPCTCTVCFGQLGCLAAGERCLSTGNRNFKGRMGHSEAEIYLSGPAVAATSAIRGKISHPSLVTDMAGVNL